MNKPRIVEAVTQPARSPSRQALADNHAEALAKQATVADLDGKISAARQATADVAAAEQAIRAYRERVDFGDAEEDATKLYGLRAVLADARGRLAATAALEAEKDQATVALQGLTQARNRLVAAILMAEAHDLAETFHAHARVAERALAGLKGLGTAAAVSGDGVLASMIGRLTSMDTEADKAASAQQTLQASLDDLEGRWRSLPIRLMADADAAVDETPPQPSEARHAA